MAVIAKTGALLTEKHGPGKFKAPTYLWVGGVILLYVGWRVVSGRGATADDGSAEGDYADGTGSYADGGAIGGGYGTSSPTGGASDDTTGGTGGGGGGGGGGTTCADGKVWDPKAKKCVKSSSGTTTKHTCPTGKVWSKKKKKCVPIVKGPSPTGGQRARLIPRCGPDQTYDGRLGKCVSNHVRPSAPLPGHLVASLPRAGKLGDPKTDHSQRREPRVRPKVSGKPQHRRG